jgi:hypothetical protein
VTSELRALVHFLCILVATLATFCFAFTFVVGMEGEAEFAAVVVALALGGAIWMHHLEAEHDRRIREQHSATWGRRDREAGLS